MSRQLSAPRSWLPSNHDREGVMQVIIKETMNQLIVGGHWVITLLDSEVVGQIHGDLLESVLSYLSDALEPYQNKHIRISFHHH